MERAAGSSGSWRASWVPAQAWLNRITLDVPYIYQTSIVFNQSVTLKLVQRSWCDWDLSLSLICISQWIFSWRWNKFMRSCWVQLDINQTFFYSKPSKMPPLAAVFYNGTEVAAWLLVETTYRVGFYRRTVSWILSLKWTFTQNDASYFWRQNIKYAPISTS